LPTPAVAQIDKETVKHGAEIALPRRFTGASGCDAQGRAVRGASEQAPCRASVRWSFSMRLELASRREGTSRRDRIGAAAGVAVLEALLAYALLSGLHVVPGVPAPDALRLLNLVPPPAPPPPKKPKPPPLKERAARPEGAAAPPNLRATPTEIVRPPPTMVFPPPPPVAAAPIAGTGAAPSAGAAPVPGPGTGAGGIGNGTGSGLGGNGTGGGGSGGGGRGRGKPPKHISGTIRHADYPEPAKEAGAQGRVWVRYTVQVDGRVGNCRILRSSGNASLDETTCRLIQQRFLFRPAKDERGRPVQADLVEGHEWDITDKPLPPETDEPDPE
jgi:protein TonB